MRSFHCSAALICAGMLWLSGCGSLPDAKPFAQASNSMADSVAASRKAIMDSMADAGDAVPGDLQNYRRLGQAFDQAWQERVQATQAAARYSESIAGLIDAGNQGAETATKVADSLGTLATTIGIPIAAPVIGVATDLARFIYARVALARASGQLEGALEQAQPAIDRMAELIASESEKQLKPILVNLHKNIQSGINGHYGADADFELALSNRRIAQRAAALNDPAEMSKLQEYESVHSAVAAKLAGRDRQLQDAAAAYRTRLQLLNAMSVATIAWARAHSDLSAAVREKRKVNVQELERTIAELKALSKKVSEL